MRTLIAGIGNILFRDDGFGVEVANRLAREPPPGAEVAEYGIRALHLGYELLTERDLLVVVDCMHRDGDPGTLYLVEPTADAEELADPHAMNLATVFSAVRRLGGTPPRTLVVGCEPASIEPGIGLSPAVTCAVPAAIDLIHELLARLEVR
jgi:hydrogenase maturation protease